MKIHRNALIPTTIKSKALIVGILLASAWVGAAPLAEHSRDYPLELSETRIDIERRRVDLSDMSGLMDRLKIGPAMTILDLGAGTGQFAYQFARKMKGSGRVFTTECKQDLVDYMVGEARRRQLGNISPVLVRCDGVDGFYGRNKFDVIFLAHVYNFIDQRVEFFRALRGSLSDQGRLVIVQQDWSPFSEKVSDPEGFVRKLSALPPTDFCRLVLSSATQAALQDPRADARQTAASAVRDFNAVGDRYRGEPEGLLPQVPSGRNRRYAQLLLDHERALKRAIPRAFIRRVGGMIFAARFKGHLSVLEGRTLELLKQELAEAGYRFEGSDPEFAQTEFAAIFSGSR